MATNSDTGSSSDTSSSVHTDDDDDETIEPVEQSRQVQQQQRPHLYHNQRINSSASFRSVSPKLSHHHHYQRYHKQAVHRMAPPPPIKEHPLPIDVDNRKSMLSSGAVAAATATRSVNYYTISAAASTRYRKLDEIFDQSMHLGSSNSNYNYC